ncbi:MAG: hypothetical protein NXH91_11970 [Phyllobacteriaceae bacterium]|nr:hypothetical protein [Phyllobacteriaceae bacterium]
MTARAQEVILIVAKAFGVTYGGIIADSRNTHETMARHVAMYVARKALGISLPDLGREMNRDHTTVLSGVRKIEGLREADPQLKALTESLVTAVEYREAARHSGEIDVLALAQSVASNPRRNAAAASVQEVAALALTFIDLWEVVSAAETLIADLGACSIDGDPDQVARIEALSAAIGDEIHHIAGDDPEDQANGDMQWKQ